MKRRVETRAESLDDAIVDAVKEITGVGEEAIDVSIEVDDDGTDLSELADIRVRIEFEVPEDEDEEDDGDGADGETDDDESDDNGGAETLSVDELDAEADAAADFLEGLLDSMGLPGDLQIRTFEDHAEVEIVEIGTGQLIGRRGQTLDAVQELLRCAIQRQFERRCRVVVDVEGYRGRRLEKLLDKAREAIDEVLDTGEERRLEPMDVFERKSVHRLVAEHEGVTSASRGREPTRRVVISAEE